jgi:hypothetical protein
LETVTETTRSKWTAVADWPTSKKACKERSQQCRILEFVHGKWFEEYVYYFASKAGGVDEDDFVVNTHFTINNEDFESDFILANGNRLRYISVTSSGSKSTCKGKVFEAVHRARQIGGGMARCAVVCLADETVLGELEGTVGASRGSGSRLQVFGEDDVRLWESGHLDSLSAFLTD